MTELTQEAVAASLLQEHQANLTATVVNAAAMTPVSEAEQHIPAGLQQILKGLNEKPPPPPPLPDQLGTWNVSITFGGGVPVGGWAQLTLRQDGSFHFTGSLHDSGATSYDASVVWAVKDSQNRVYTFTQSGRLHGTFEAGSRDLNWDSSGNNGSISADWADLVGGWSYRCEASVNLDIGPLVDDVVKALGVVAAVIAIV